MSNMVVATVAIEGTRPLLWRCFGEEALPLHAAERTGVAGNDPEEWKKTHTATKDGQLFLESTYAFATIRDGARYTKKGRGSVQPLVCATLQILDERILIDRFLPSGEIPRDPESPVYIDVRGVKNPTTKARNVRYRVAASSGWKASFRMLWDKTIVSRVQMEAIVHDSGKLCGVADGRSIGFGRFAVVSFDVTEA